MEILIIAFLIALNAFFVIAEYALIRVRRSRIEQLVEEGNRSAKRVNRLIAQPGRFLATIQIGVTFVGFLAAAFAGASLVDDLERLLTGIPAVGSQANIVALLIVTAILALFTIVFGELLPRAVALAHAETLALILAVPVEILGRVLNPLVW